MRIAVLIVGLAASTFTLSIASADELDAAPVSAKRQMVICMNKGMSANKTLSYNDAQRDCKEKLLAHVQTGNGTGKRQLTANAADAPALKSP
jgi:hypothetical protein